MEQLARGWSEVMGAFLRRKQVVALTRRRGKVKVRSSSRSRESCSECVRMATSYVGEGSRQSRVSVYREGARRAAGPGALIRRTLRTQERPD